MYNGIVFNDLLYEICLYFALFDCLSTIFFILDSILNFISRLKLLLFYAIWGMAWLEINL